MAKSKKRGSGNVRKIGRDLIKSAKYRADNKREKNKIKKLVKYLKIHPNNSVAKNKLTELQKEVGV